MAGHLANHQSAQLLQLLPLPRLPHLVGTRLSEQNNLPTYANQALD